MTNEEFNEYFRERTLKFGLDILAFIGNLPFNAATKVMSYQLGKAGAWCKLSCFLPGKIKK